jgi:hypothetical protein
LSFLGARRLLTVPTCQLPHDRQRYVQRLGFRRAAIFASFGLSKATLPSQPASR